MAVVLIFMRFLSMTILVLCIPTVVGAQPRLDYCAAIAPRGTPPSEREARLLAQVTHASRNLDAAFQLFESLRPGLSRENASKLYWLTVRQLLEAKQGLCSCSPLGSAQPMCEQLPAELARSCELQPHHLHGINVHCLTKGR